jgi:hypothetical protein
MRCSTQEAWNTSLQGQVVEHGHMDHRSGRGMPSVSTPTLSTTTPLPHTADGLQNMRRAGNTASNRIYNPRNAHAAIPIDVDEVDGVMERFIRQKYETKALSSDSQPASRQHTGSTGSSDDRSAKRSAELPPKPPKRFTFGLRSTSSALPLRSDARSPPLSPNPATGFGSASTRDSPPLRRNKPSKIFGTDIGGSRQDNYELKLIALKEMGFPDDRRNFAILKGEGGNVDKAVATLIRLGEGNNLSSGQSSPAPEIPPKDETLAGTAGASKALNPFDRLDLQDKALPPPPPVEEQRPHTCNPPGTGAYNPFVQQQQQPPSQQSLQRRFLGLTVQQPSQLFPNTTGGYIQPSPVTTNPFLQSYTPPPPQSQPPPQPQSPSQSQPQFTLTQQNAFAPGLNYTPAPQGYAPQPTTMGNFNPFTQSSNQPQFPMTNPFGLTNPSNNAFPMQSNQFQQQPTSPVYGQTEPSQSANPFFQSQAPQPQFLGHLPLTQSPSPGQNQYNGNPFESSFQAHYSHSVPLPTPVAPTAARIDKASILALYNLPAGSSQSNQYSGAIAPGTEQQPVQAPAAAQRSTTMPLPSTGSNPFAVGSSGPAVPKMAAGGNSPFAHISHESVDFSTMMNGRHSPDAFAGLSARIMR